MLKRLRPRLSFANVMSSIAVFLALGGGYATAFSGSGTVQKGALLNIPNGAVTVRSLTGIGAIKASCSGGSPSVALENTSGEQLAVGGVGIDDYIGFGIEDGESENLDPEVDGFNEMNVHISPGDGSKRPQADVQITADDGADTCATSSVAVLATNTEE
jgi:hypothetical protein